MKWLISIVVFMLLCNPAAAGDWPQWLGPTRDAVSSETIAPWKGDLKVVWRTPIGEGNSSPVIADGRIFIHAKVKDKNEEEVLAFDAKTGKPLWQKSYPRVAFQSLFGNGPRATPAISDNRIYTHGITGVLTCYEADGGKQLWQVDTHKDFKATNLMFGSAGSPLVDGNKVIVNIGAMGASIVAFDKIKGEVAWKALDDRASYSSPILLEAGKKRQLITLTQQGLTSIDPADGSLFWKFPLVDKLLESSSTPARAGEYLIASSITYGSAGLKMLTKEDKPGVEQAWKNEALTCYFSTPVPVGLDHLYVVTGTKPPALKSEATLHCVEVKTGKVLWRKGKVGTYHATLVRTGNNKLLMLEDTGHLVLIDPNPKEYRELARSKICGEVWAHPAFSDGKLYVRDNKELLCLELPK